LKPLLFAFLKHNVFYHPQEVEKAAKDIHYDFSGVDKPKNEKDLYGLRYETFVVPLVKAVQELSKDKKELKEVVNTQQQQINELKDVVNKLTGNANNSTNTTLNLSCAYLEQSTPNPSNGNAVIRYHIPGNSSATLVFTDMKGSVIKSLAVSKGNGQVALNTQTLAASSYSYTLYENGRQVDSKQMLIAP